MPRLLAEVKGTTGMAKLGDHYGPYVSARRLGAGGMAHTFLGCRRGSEGFEQRVCIKVMRDYGHMSGDAQRLFAQEANFAALLRHSNIVSIVDVIEEGALILELVDGVDLRAVMRAATEPGLASDLAVYIIMELCKALDYAHNRTLRGRPYGIVHRDLSPSNVLISYAGEVKLTDFGIAKAVARPSEGHSAIRGKLAYMAPEQATGQVVDGRTDLFALGIVMYELLSGTRPFDASGDAATLRRVLSGEHVLLGEVAPTVPAGLVAIVERLLRPDPHERFASAAAVMEALLDFCPSPLAYRQLGALATQAKPHETLLTDFTVPIHPALSSQDVVFEAESTAQETMPLAEHHALTTSGASLESAGVGRHPIWWLLSLSIVLLVAVSLLALGVGNPEKRETSDHGAEMPAVMVP